MRPLAYLFIVLVPLIAVATIAIAVLPSRSAPLRGVATDELRRRLDAIDAQLTGAAAQPGQPAGELAKDRRRLRTELLRRGHGREPGAQI